MIVFLIFHLILLFSGVRSFDFRREIIISNPTSTDTDDAVILVEIDTLQLIQQQKILSTCQDITFTNNQESQYYQSWVEAGCNEVKTSFWVTIPTLPAAGMTIQLRYGDPSYSEQRKQTIHSYMMMSDETCKQGWNKHTDTSSDGKFVFASNSMGEVLLGDKHYHEVDGDNNEIETGGCNVYTDVMENGCCGTFVLESHIHESEDRSNQLDTTDDSIDPNHLKVMICSRRGYVSSFPKGSIVLVENAGSIPDASYGWSVKTDMNERFAKITMDEGLVGTFAGGHVHKIDLGEHDLRQYSYTYTKPATTSNDLIDCIDRYNHEDYYTFEWYGLTGPPTSSSMYPDHTTMIFLEVTNEKAFPFEGMIILANWKPILGYEKYEFNTSSSIPRGCLAGEENIFHAGTSSNHKHDIAQWIMKAPTSGGFPMERGGGAGSFGACPMNHIHTVIGNPPTQTENAVTGSNVDKYGFLFYRRKGSEFPVSIGAEIAEITSIVKCFGLQFNDDRVCNGKGQCTGHQTCECFPDSHYYGVNCIEYIENSGVFSTTSSLRINWIAGLDIIEPTFTTDTSLDCISVINNMEVFDMFVGVSVTCEWIVEVLYSTSLVITLSSPQSYEVLNQLPIIELIPLTASSQVVEVTMIPIVGTTDIVTLLLLIIIPTTLICCILIACVIFWTVIFTFVGRIFFKQSKKLERFNKLENIDVVLKEKELQSNDDFSKIKFNKKLFEINYKEIKLKKEIGSGGSGNKIYLAEWKGMYCAYKSFRIFDYTDESNFEEFEKEVKILASVRHPHILEFFGASLSLPRIGFLMEYCEKGDFKQFFERMKLKGKTYPLVERIRLLKETALAMKHLHSINIIHRDLKSQNILVSDVEEAKVMDFGLSKAYLPSDKQTRRLGTNYYISPEMFLGKKYTGKCDVFSFGIVMFEVLALNFKNPFEGVYKLDDNIGLKMANDPAYRPDVKKLNGMPSWIINLVQTCWDNDPKVRKKFVEIERIFREERINVQMSGGNKKNKRMSIKPFRSVFSEIEEMRMEMISLKESGEKKFKKNEMEILNMKREYRKIMSSRKRN